MCCSCFFFFMKVLKMTPLRFLAGYSITIIPPNPSFSCPPRTLQPSYRLTWLSAVITFFPSSWSMLWICLLGLKRISCPQALSHRMYLAWHFASTGILLRNWGHCNSFCLCFIYLFFYPRSFVRAVKKETTTTACYSMTKSTPMNRWSTPCRRLSTAARKKPSASPPLWTETSVLHWFTRELLARL